MAMELERPVESGYQLVGSGPEAYEAYLVPPLFTPCAEHLLAAVGVGPGDRVVDVACGTGVVGRRAAELVGPTGSVVGVDLNPAMVGLAARLGPGVDWEVADAAGLPLVDASVDVWCCQQGLQFVPDRRAVLEEARRVLRPGGRGAVAIWREVAHSPAFAGFAEALADVAGEDAAAMMRAPFAFSDRDALRELLGAAGFTDARLTVLAFAARFPSARELLRQEVAASPLSDVVDRLPPDDRERLAVELERRLDHVTDDEGVLARCRPGSPSLREVAADRVSGRSVTPRGRTPTVACR